MPAQISGFDQYSGSLRTVTITRIGGHVLLEVEGGDGNGAAMLTPAEARAVASGLHAQADFATKASEMSGHFDPPDEESS